ncbi:hypothetical protein B0H10DRAFT_2162890 [Mycena sp. CBHHK59/15]|nr:hypothetical protein B0H10DRAFT_2162890 [Mycena sp. CBHHK59/15]
MAKRRATVDTDDENSAAGSPASKRARTADSDDERQRERRPRASKGKGKARRTDDDDDEEGDDDEEDAAEEERLFEEAHEEKIRAQLDAKRKVHGGIAEHGIIEAIEMHQFMCHKYLTFSFGPQINFIIGGKSAVLSAITVALGGKANSTGRGNGLKSFIREGQPAAEVTISLKNQGEEAYKPKEYGKSIVITRRFTKEGSTSWKIKSRDGRVISTKKDELAAICDHMNIQVDNPMNVLTQDAARQFLSASLPADKYKFFLRGTQLSQLSDEYDTCFANITATTKVLAQKKEALPDLRTAFREASTRFEEAAKAREQKKKVDALKKELAWAHVNAKREEMEEKIEEAARAARRLPRIDKSIKDAQASRLFGFWFGTALEAANEQVAQFEHEFATVGDKRELVDKRAEVSNELRTNKTKLIDLNNDLRSMNNSIKSTNKQIEEYKAAIEAERKRLEIDTHAKREETQSKLADAREAVTTADGKFADVQKRKADAEAELARLRAVGNAAQARRDELRAQILECDTAMTTCARAESDRFAAYGSSIQQVVARIGQTRWMGTPPIGPFGIHVRVRDARWGDVLRTQLGGLLSSFAVTDTRDQPTLKRILAEFGNHRTSIVIFTPDLFDYSQGEPPAEVLTVLRVLEITDPHVLRIMINKASIESRVLAEKRKEGENVLARLGGGAAWTLDRFALTRYAEGGESSLPFRLGRMHPMLLTGSATDELQRWRDKKVDTERQLQDAEAAMRAAQAEWNTARRGLDGLVREERAAADELTRAKAYVRELQQEVNDDMPAQLAGFQAALEEAEGEKSSLIEQFTDVTEQKARLDETQKELVRRKDELQDEITDFEGRQKAAQDNINAAALVRTKALSDIKHWETKLAEEREKVAAADATSALVQQEFAEWTEKAAKYCEEVQTNRRVDEIERNLRSTQQALQEREKRHGASVEDMTIEVNRAKQKLEDAERDLRQMTSLNKALKASLIVRLSRWQEFRRHIALRCKLVFGYHLSQRGYYGKVLFDHEKQTLQLKVQTDDQAATQGARDKDPRSLSGGEKSFSTICLLLSLWESIGCPLRCLDEFDVFMDAVNRRISMKMMIDTANQSDKKQYVLITPQDMNNVVIGKTVRVHRMTDPERGQGVLAF